MENKKRVYLVQFSDSKTYRVEFEDVENVDPYHHTDPLKDVEKEIKDYLEKEFPGQSLPYYSTPKVTEVDPARKDEYEKYPVLNQDEIDKIKAELKRQIEVRDDDQMLSSDAPYSDIPGMPGQL